MTKAVEILKKAYPQAKVQLTKNTLKGSYLKITNDKGLDLLAKATCSDPELTSANYSDYNTYLIKVYDVDQIATLRAMPRERKGVYEVEFLTEGTCRNFEVPLEEAF